MQCFIAKESEITLQTLLIFKSTHLWGDKETNSKGKKKLQTLTH